MHCILSFFISNHAILFQYYSAALQLRGEGVDGLLMALTMTLSCAAVARSFHTVFQKPPTRWHENATGKRAREFKLNILRFASISKPTSFVFTMIADREI